MKNYFPEMFYVRGEVPASILHLLPNSVARKHTCFTSDAHPAMTPSEALWCQKHTGLLLDDGIRDMGKKWNDRRVREKEGWRSQSGTEREESSTVSWLSSSAETDVMASADVFDQRESLNESKSFIILAFCSNLVSYFLQCFLHQVQELNESCY